MAPASVSSCGWEFRLKPGAAPVLIQILLVLERSVVQSGRPLVSSYRISF